VPSDAQLARPLRIGVSGAPGVGKTTLARALGDALGIPVLPEEMRAHLERTGQPLTELARDDAAQVLHALWRERAGRERATPSFVADNSCLDFAAYAVFYDCLAEPAPGEPDEPVLLREPRAHLADYDAIIVLPCGVLPYERDGVRPASRSAQLRHHLIIDGMLRRWAAPRQLHHLPAACLALADRVAWVRALIAALPDRATDGAQTALAATPGAAADWRGVRPGSTAIAAAGRPASAERPDATATDRTAPAHRADAAMAAGRPAMAHAAAPAGAPATAAATESAAPTSRRGTVYLVGAGPGDPALLTLRARELLAAADVVAYDALVSPEILAQIRPGAELVPVGRRHGGGATSYRLHPDVIPRALAGRSVVRLKAGDPLIFGRGGEEAEELREAGIAFEIVPGVSAALGAAAYAGIPLTHRDHASDVTFVSGHDAGGDRRSLTDWTSLGRGTGTLVLFMAARTLATNLARLVAAGRASTTPAAYVASATTPQQHVVTGTLATLAAQAVSADQTAPALVIVGDVVGLRDRLAWFAPGTATAQLRDSTESSPAARAQDLARPRSKAGNVDVAVDLDRNVDLDGDVDVDSFVDLAPRPTGPTPPALPDETPVNLEVNEGGNLNVAVNLNEDGQGQGRGQELPRSNAISSAVTASDAAGAAKPAARGLLVVYTGQGKGKTTAALGIVFRALGRGMRVAVVQFIKGKWKTGERLFADTIPGLTFLVMGKGFTWNSDDLGQDRVAAIAAWAKVKQLLASGEHDIVIVDEITYAINYGFIELDDVLAALRARPPHVHVVATGRNAPEGLCALADLVTDMAVVKHPFASGVKAQLGIDY
jgi:cob(I)alamin adenosyltransferase